MFAASPQFGQLIITIQNMIAEIMQSLSEFSVFENLWTYILVTLALLWSIFTFLYIITNSIAWRSVLALCGLFVIIMISISLISYQFLSTVLQDLCYELFNPTGFISFVPKNDLQQVTQTLCYLQKDFDMIITGNSLLVAGMMIFTILVFL